MENIILIAIIIAVIGTASLYVWKAKKKGTKCIGCSMGGNCSGCCGNMNDRQSGT